jgi:hypothetical protein
MVVASCTYVFLSQITRLVSFAGTYVRIIRLPLPGFPSLRTIAMTCIDIHQGPCDPLLLRDNAGAARRDDINGESPLYFNLFRQVYISYSNTLKRCRYIGTLQIPVQCCQLPPLRLSGASHLFILRSSTADCLPGVCTYDQTAQ